MLPRVVEAKVYACMVVLFQLWLMVNVRRVVLGAWRSSTLETQACDLRALWCLEATVTAIATVTVWTLGMERERERG